jgi:hypothetical protein
VTSSLSFSREWGMECESASAYDVLLGHHDFGSSVHCCLISRLQEQATGPSFSLLAIFRNANVMIIQSKTTPCRPHSFPPLLSANHCQREKSLHPLSSLSTETPAIAFRRSPSLGVTSQYQSQLQAQGHHSAGRSSAAAQPGKYEPARSPW